MLSLFVLVGCDELFLQQPDEDARVRRRQQVIERFAKLEQK